MEPDPEALALFQEGYKSYNRDGPRALADILHPDFELHVSGLFLDGRVYHGLEGWERWEREMSESFEYRLEPTESRPLDEARMIVTGTLHIKGKGSGVTVEEPFAHVLTRKDELFWRLEFLSGADEAGKLAGLPRDVATS